jgi:hypothetical protein
LAIDPSAPATLYAGGAVFLRRPTEEPVGLRSTRASRP